MDVVAEGIPCFGGQHRLGWDGNELVKLDHQGDDAELALAVLMGDEDVCGGVIERIGISDPAWALDLFLDAERWAASCRLSAEATAATAGMVGLPPEVRRSYLIDAWARTTLLGMPPEAQRAWAARGLDLFAAAWSGKKRPQGAADVSKRLRNWVVFTAFAAARGRPKDRTPVTVHLDPPGSGEARTERRDGGLHVHLPADRLSDPATFAGLPPEV